MSNETQVETAQETPKVEATQEQPQVKAPEATLLASMPEKKEIAPEKTSTPEPVIPEKYELKLKEDSFLNAAQVQAVESYAKANKMTNEQAQALLEREESAVNNFAHESLAAFEKTKATWVEAIKNDKEIGGDSFNQTLEIAKRTVAKFASEELIEELVKTGYGNHPELVRLFARIGNAMKDDVMIHPGAQSAPKKSGLEHFYKDHQN